MDSRLNDLYSPSIADVHEPAVVSLSSESLKFKDIVGRWLTIFTLGLWELFHGTPCSYFNLY